MNRCRNPLPLLLLIVITSAAALLRGTTITPGVTGAIEERIDPSDFPIFTDSAPSCSVTVLEHKFDDTSEPVRPVSTNYTLPGESCRWNRAILEFSSSSSSSASSSSRLSTSFEDRRARIAAVWIDGVEVLRTSTAESIDLNRSTSNNSIIYWKVQKDVTRYSSLFRRAPVVASNNVTGVISATIRKTDNDDVYSRVYDVNISLFFYFDKDGGDSPTVEKLELLYGTPADLVIPMKNTDEDDCGYWFRIQNDGDVYTGDVQIPKNAYRAVLELIVSAHSDDEYWYEFDNGTPTLPTPIYPSKRRGNGSFRQLFATVGCYFAGSTTPFPILYSTSLSPFLWSPVAAISAFDIPSYDIELTPLLSLFLSDQNHHHISVGITNSIPFWLVGANIHIWVDPNSDVVQARILRHFTPDFSYSWSSSTHGLDGKFEIEAERDIEISGWVNSSIGNITTCIEQELKFKSIVEYKNNGNLKKASMKSESKIELKLSSETQSVKIKKSSKFPIKIQTEKDYNMITANVTHQLKEKVIVESNGVKNVSVIEEKQSGGSWMEVGGGVLVNGGQTEQSYSWSSNGGKCYLRSITASDGVIQKDANSSDCGYKYNPDLMMIMMGRSRAKENKVLNVE